MRYTCARCEQRKVGEPQQIATKPRIRRRPRNGQIRHNLRGDNLHSQYGTRNNKYIDKRIQTHDFALKKYRNKINSPTSIINKIKQ